MGTSMAFYHIKNEGFDRERLQTVMERSFEKEKGAPQADGFYKAIRRLYGEDAYRKFKPIFEQAEQKLRDHQKQAPSDFDQTLPSPMVAYRQDAAWLPFFEVNICEGYNATSKDARRLSKAFGAPVLVFSIFDSDILMVSYSDAAKKIAYDYAKPNVEGMEEYDRSLFKNMLPTFLLELCPTLTEEKLREIWNGDEVFADDRMYKLGEVLGLSPINGKVPEGFEVITAD